MDPRITQITEYLDKVAAKLGLGAQEIWPWFIRQQYVEALQFLVFGIPLLIFGVWIATKIKQCARMYDNEELTRSEKDTTEVLLGFATIIVGGLGVVLTCKGCVEAFQLLNVEYAALQDLLRMVK